MRWIVLVFLLLQTAIARADGQTFVPRRAASAREQPGGGPVVAALEAGQAYPLVKVGGPGKKWCKIRVGAATGWVLCAEATDAPVPNSHSTQPVHSPQKDHEEFSYYLLTLSWSPSFCATHGSDNDQQCGNGRHFGFVVHGLWPQYERGYPQSCRTAEALDTALVEQMLPLMPSDKLIRHEWEKHGTCSGLDASGYFSKVRAAREAVQIPSVLLQPAEPVSADLATIERMFIEANPALHENMIAVSCKSTVSEVRVCMDKDLHFRACGADVKDQCRGPTRFPAIR